MLRKAAMAFGVVFIAIGLLGFVPALTPDGKLLGIFHVDAVHNMIHLLSGAAALLSLAFAAGPRLYFQIFGVIYAIVAIGGFIPALQFGEDMKLLGLTHVGMNDNILHIVIAASSLYLGFGYRDDERVEA